MRKIIGLILLAVLVLGISITAEYLAPETHKRIYHHREAQDAAFCETTAEGEFCSHLPVVMVDTLGGTMSHEQEILTKIRILDHKGGHNHLGDQPDLEVSSLMKLRGNSSSRFDKPQYRLTFVDDTGYGTEINDLQMLPHLQKKVMGMPRESEWILNGPFLDHTLMRNYLMYNLAGEIMEWAPNVRYCEVFLDGEYEGIYLMIEAVKADKNRVHMNELNPGRIGTSYMVQRERPGDTSWPLSNFGTYSGKTHNELGVQYPGLRSGRQEQHMEFVRQDISAFEKMLYSLDYDDLAIGYQSAIDVESFVDYYILNEFAMNVDGGNLSTFAHKDLGGKLVMGPVWDFNNGFDNYEYYTLDDDEFYLIGHSWYVMLLRDEKFVENIIDRYAVLREGPLSEEAIYRTLDETIDFLGPALARNEARWGYSYQDGWLDNFDIGRNALTYDRNPKDYDDAVTQLKDCIHRRGDFMDQYIHVLRQFCAESKVKEWN